MPASNLTDVIKRIREIHSEMQDIRDGDTDLSFSERREELNDLRIELQQLNDTLNSVER